MTEAAEKPAPLDGEYQAPRPAWESDYSQPIQRAEGGRFGPGNAWAFKPGHPGGPGRIPGLRNKVTSNFLLALSEDFERHGVKAIQRMRNAKPHLYVQVIASLLPKQVQIEDKPFDDLGDVDLAAIILAAQAALSAHRDTGARAEEAVGHQPAAELPALPETA